MGIQSAFGDFGVFVAILTTLYIAVSFWWTIPIYIWSVTGLGCLFIGITLTRQTPEKYLISEFSKNKKQTASEAITEWVYIIKRFKLLIPLFIVSGASWGITISYLPLFLDEKNNSCIIIYQINNISMGWNRSYCLFFLWENPITYKT